MLIALLAALCTAGRCAGPNRNNRNAEDLQKQFLAVQTDYHIKKESGHDLSHITPMITKLDRAKQRRDWTTFAELLDQIERELNAISEPTIDIPDQAPTVKEGSFGFGIEYARVGIASRYRQIGATWVRIGPVMWGRFEPSEPVSGRHTYDWRLLDRLIMEYQANGFVNAQLVVSSKNDWANSPGSNLGPETATPPKKGFWKYYGAFIQAMAERYDMDGHDDLPGLLFPVQYFAIESEAQHPGYWKGTAGEYQRLLQIAYQSAHEANPDCRIMLSGINFGDVFDDRPGNKELQNRIDQFPSHRRNSFEFIKQSLTYNRWFDVVSIHYNYDYQGLYGVVGWIRAQMKENGYDKPIWAGDAAAAPMLDSIYQFDLSKSQSDLIHKSISTPKHPEHEKWTRWYERKQAGSLIKKALCAMELGLQGVNYANFRDWPEDYWGGRNWTYQGLRRRDGSARPSFYAYQLLVDKIKMYDSITRMTDSDSDIYAYLLNVGDHRVYVVWCENDKKEFAFEIPTPQATATRIDFNQTSNTHQNASEPYRRETLTTNDHVLTVMLTSDPVFIEPVESAP